VQMLGLGMRIFSFAFHLLLGLVMMAIAFVAWASSQHTLQIGFLPWQGTALTYWLFFSGLAGVILTFLAIQGILRPLFLLWSLAVLAMLVRGVFFTGFNFGYAAGTIPAALGQLVLSTPVLLMIAALLAVVGSLTSLRRRPEPLRRHTAVA
jgi:hypothetical protein